MAKPLPANIAEKMLDRLSTDDDFRAYFQKDARGALSFLGYDEPVGTPNNDSALMCMRCDSLPDKQAFVKSREAFRKQLSAKTDQRIFLI
jgi:putative modified peptide